MIARFNTSSKKLPGNIVITKSTDHSQTVEFVKVQLDNLVLERSFPNSLSGNLKKKEFVEQFSSVENVREYFSKRMKR